MLWGSEGAVVNSLHQFTKKVLVTNLPIQVECKKYHNSLFKIFYPLFLKGHISPITRYALLTSSSSRHPKKFPLQFIQKDLFQHSLGCPFLFDIQRMFLYLCILSLWRGDWPAYFVCTWTVFEDSSSRTRFLILDWFLFRCCCWENG